MTSSARQLAIEAAKRLKQVWDGNDKREACERVYGSYERSEELGPIDCRTAVEYLTSLPQPDPGPIDAEWLLSIGGKSKDGLDWDVSAGDDVVVFVAIGLDHDPWVYIRQDDSDCVFVRAMTDRDDLRRLIAALKGGAE